MHAVLAENSRTRKNHAVGTLTLLLVSEYPIARCSNLRERRPANCWATANEKGVLHRYCLKKSGNRVYAS